MRVSPSSRLALAAILLSSPGAFAGSHDDAFEVNLSVKQWSLQKWHQSGDVSVVERGAIPEVGLRGRLQTHKGTVTHEGGISVAEGRTRREGVAVEGPGLMSDSRYRAMVAGYQWTTQIPQLPRMHFTVGADFEKRTRGAWSASLGKAYVEQVQHGVLRTGVEWDALGNLPLYGAAGFNMTAGARVRTEGKRLGYAEDLLFRPSARVGGFLKLGTALNSRLSLEFTHEHLAFGPAPSVSAPKASGVVDVLNQPRAALARTGIRVVARF